MADIDKVHYYIALYFIYFVLISKCIITKIKFFLLLCINFPEVLVDNEMHISTSQSTKF